MLYTGCIVRQPEIPRIVRICIMSRLTLNDGITPHQGILKSSFEYHLSELGPSPRLIGDYYKRGLSWTEFEHRYLGEIRTSPKMFTVQTLAYIATIIDVLILCIEDCPEFCHRRLLARECLRYQPCLHIEHR